MKNNDDQGEDEDDDAGADADFLFGLIRSHTIN